MVSNTILKKLGLTEKEAKIYLACLELGTGTVVKISRKAEITRGSTYDVLEEMLDKGYVSKLHKDKHMVFSAVDPEILMKNYKDRLRDFEMALPELKGLFNQYSSRPKVRYFEGLDGIKRVYASLFGRALITQREANAIIGTLRGILRSLEDEHPPWDKCGK